ncbi:MAG: hypothetical protein V4563_17270 [Pseudomonadota bacterium]
MAQMRNSKKNIAEIYASELSNMNIAHYQALVTKLNAPVTTTPVATSSISLQGTVPMLMIGAGALVLLLILRK